MLSAQLLELNAAKAKVAQLEAEIAGELHRSFVDLPSQFGFNDTTSFLAAVQAAAGSTMRRGRKAMAKATRRTRATITAGTHSAVKKLVKAGKTGSVIAAELGISVPSVQNIKKALGLVRASKPVVAAKAKPARKAAGKKSVRRKRTPQPKTPATAATATEATAPTPASA
jgi:hypothetical protein